MANMTMAELEWPEKQVADVLDYSVKLGDELVPGASIVKVLASVRPSGMSELSVGGRGSGLQLYVNEDTITVWLQGGVADRSYLVRLVASDNLSRTFDILVTLRVSRVLAPTPIAEPSVDDFSTPVEWDYVPPLMGAAIISGEGTMTV